MRKCISVLLAALLVLSLVPLAFAEGEVTLAVVTWDVATTSYYAAYKDAFEAANPGIKIEYVDISAQDYDNNKAGTLLVGGDKSDIFFIKQLKDANIWSQQGFIEPLDEYIAASGFDMSNYGGMSECYIDNNGAQVGLPFRADYWVLFYNKGLFDKAGVAYPTNDMTWEEYKELAIKMTSGTEGVDKIYGTHYHTWMSDVVNWTVCDGVNTLIDGNYDDLAYFYGIVQTLEDAEACRLYTDVKAANLAYRGAFAAGDIAMIPMGYWFLSSLISYAKDGTIDFDYGFVSVPHLEGVPAGSSFGSPTAAAINKISEHKEEAWKFLSFIAGEEGAKALVPTGNRPAYINAAVADVMASVDGFPTDEASKAALIPYAVYLEMVPGEKSPAIQVMLNEEHTLIMTREQTIEEGIANMNERAAEILAK